MKLVPNDWDEYNPVLVLMGAGFVIGGGYPLTFMGVSGPLVLWLVRGPCVILATIGAITLVRQFQLRRRGPTSK